MRNARETAWIDFLDTRGIGWRGGQLLIFNGTRLEAART